MSHPNNNVGSCDVNNNHQAYGFHGDDTNYNYNPYPSDEDEQAYREFYGLDDDDTYQYLDDLYNNLNNDTDNSDGAAINAALQVEEDEATRNERLFKQFILNFHNGNYDNEINAALSLFSASSDNEVYNNNDGAPPADDN